MHPPAKKLFRQTASKFYGTSQDSLDSFARASHGLHNSALFDTEVASCVDLVGCDNSDSRNDFARIIVLTVSREPTGRRHLHVLFYYVDSLTTNR